MKAHLPPALFVLVLLLVLVITALPASADGINPPTYEERTVTLLNGLTAAKAIINGPPIPPPGYESDNAAPADPTGTETIVELPVPAYTWYYGCAATSAAMIAGYYDRNDYPNMYTGPTNGGVMPIDSSGFPVWRQGSYSYPQCALTASRQGLEGRTSKGSIDDYWVAYNSGADDPYITGGWTEHQYGDAIGDYMRTGQSQYDLVDGATGFWLPSGSGILTCDALEDLGLIDDGNLGRKLFYEQRGYTVTECYSQLTDNNGGGFTLVKYKAEIDAGRPVMLHLVGHTVVGIGYDTASSRIYIHDTWSTTRQYMTWGGSYQGRAMQMVSIANLVPACAAPADVTNLDIGLLDAGQVELTWNAASGAHHYEVWSAANKPFFTPGANCGAPGSSLRCSSVTPNEFSEAILGDPANNHTYVVRAVSACGSKSSRLSDRVAEFEYELEPGSS